jgi:hypothetical protein
MQNTWALARSASPFSILPSSVTLDHNIECILGSLPLKDMAPATERPSSPAAHGHPKHSQEPTPVSAFEFGGTARSPFTNSTPTSIFGSSPLSASRLASRPASSSTAASTNNVPSSPATFKFELSHGTSIQSMPALFHTENADISMLVKSSWLQEYTIKVSSHAMSLANPMFKMLIDRLSKLNSISLTKLDLRDDNWDALCILLKIVHFQFDSLPDEVSFPTLVHLSKLCDQYDCVKLAQPWVRSWANEEKFKLLKTGHEEWLTIAWVFGRTRTFEKLANELILTIQVSTFGYALNHKSSPFPTFLPLDIMGKFKNST